MKLKIFILFCLCFAQIANAELTIEITKGSDSALPIAVVPFANKGGAALPHDIARIVANDLQRSGVFETLSTSNM